MADTSNDQPRFPTCDDNTGMNRHTLETAWGETWCSCDHTCMVYQRDPRHDGIDADHLPVWWNRALREALDAAEDSGFDLSTAWAHLRILASDLAADGTYERWDEFAPHVIELDQGPAEELLRLLATAGIADVGVGAWEYQDENGDRRWHGADEGCGCTLVDIELQTEQKASA